MEQFAQKSQEKLETLPVARAGIQSLFRDGPLGANLATPTWGEQSPQQVAILILKGDPEAGELGADIPLAGSEPFGQNPPDIRIFVVEQLDQMGKLILNMHHTSAPARGSVRSLGPEPCRCNFEDEKNGVLSIP